MRRTSYWTCGVNIYFKERRYAPISSLKNNKTCALFVTKNATRMTTKSVQDVVKKYLNKAGLGNRGISTHKLRHTAATTMFKYGHVDVRTLQQLLVHENLNTTQIYTAVDNDQLQSAVNSNPLASMFGR